MFDTIILLTSAVEWLTFMTVLSAHNPSLTIVPVETLTDLNAQESDTLARARLIAFVTGVIVPPNVLDQLGYGAYNFHPGPPTYPGWAPAHFALYKRATEFGATAHVMVARVDEGPIVAVEMFSFPPGASVASLEGMAHGRLAYLFWTLAKQLATCSEPLAQLPLRWSGTKNTRRSYAAISGISSYNTRDELNLRINVFGEHHFGIAPTVHLHGIQSRALPAVAAQNDSPGVQARFELIDHSTLGLHLPRKT
jgi:methionyl-tRNA formyltransferase